MKPLSAFFTSVQWCASVLLVVYAYIHTQSDTLDTTPLPSYQRQPSRDRMLRGVRDELASNSQASAKKEEDEDEEQRDFKFILIQRQLWLMR